MWSSVVRLAEGWVLAAGGRVKHGSTDRCALYNPASNEWHEMPSMPSPCEQHVLVIASGQVFAIGAPGRNQTMWSWLPGDEQWIEHPPTLFSGSVRSLALDDGSIAVWPRFGGGELRRWDRGDWTNLGPLDAGVCMLPTATGFVVFGGERRIENDLACHAHAEVREFRVDDGWIPWPDASEERPLELWTPG